MEPQIDPFKPVPAAPAAATADPARDESIVRRLWNVFRREPMLLVTSSYLFVSVVGLWDSYWFYRRFEIPILEYMQISDYFVSGLRRPAYLVLLLVTLVVSVLVLWPERWRQRNPARVAAVERRWWGRVLFPRRSDWWMYFGLHPETMATVSSLVVMAFLMQTEGSERGRRIHDGAGDRVNVRVGEARGDLAGNWRLLGTSSAFVFLWDPDARRAEVVPIESLSGLSPAPRAEPAPASATVPAGPRG